MNDWKKALNVARKTVNKYPTNKEPSFKWKRKMLLAEHSPIRLVRVQVTLANLKSWISVHLIRHNVGITHFVSTQRDDRTGLDRDSKRQDAIVNHAFEANAQAMINISRKRLCKNSHKETVEAWKRALESIKESEPELYHVCVPECIYRGFCPEMKSCGYSKTNLFEFELKKYRENV